MLKKKEACPHFDFGSGGEYTWMKPSYFVLDYDLFAASWDSVNEAPSCK
jgi:hypothetical protein